MQQRVCDTLRREDGLGHSRFLLVLGWTAIHPGSATIESSTVLLSQEIADEDTTRVNYAAPRDSVEQGAHIASEEVAIFPAHTNFTTKIRTGLLGSDS